MRPFAMKLAVGLEYLCTFAPAFSANIFFIENNVHRAENAVCEWRSQGQDSPLHFGFNPTQLAAAEQSNERGTGGVSIGTVLCSLILIPGTTKKIGPGYTTAMQVIFFAQPKYVLENPVLHVYCMDVYICTYKHTHL